MGEWNEVKTPWVKWGKIGDNIEGTLVDVREIASQLPGKVGEKTKVYEIKADRGSYHETDANKVAEMTPVTIVAGEVYAVGGRMGIDAQMRRIVIGQKVRFTFTDEKPPKQKGFNALKIIKVLTNGEMDQAWLDGREATPADTGF